MYLYLASPYSHDDEQIVQSRFIWARDVTAHLLRRQVAVYSPIVHCHEISKLHSLPGDFEFWMRYNYRMLSPAKKLIVLQIPGWESSVGVRAEIDYARTHGKPILFRKPPEILNDDYTTDDYML